MRVGFLCFSAIMLLGATGPDDSYSLERSRRAHSISRQVMSPYCPGRTLADCPSPDAGALRQEIRELVGSGRDESAILSALRERYGDAVVGVPEGAWANALPVIVLLLGGLVLFVVLRRQIRN